MSVTVVPPGNDAVHVGGHWIPAGVLDTDPVPAPSSTTVSVSPILVRPIWFPTDSANQMLPSGPAVMPSGALSAVGIGNSVTVPIGVPGWATGLMRAMLLPSRSVNQRLPSAPAVMPVGALLA